MATPTITARPESEVNGITSRWNAANLPLQYEIANTKWPVNTDDLTDGFGSVTSNGGYARLIQSSTNETYTAKLWVKVTGSTYYDGIHRIRSIGSGSITIDFPFNTSDTGTIQIYYQNYTTLVKVYAGLDPAHDHAATKPLTLIGTIEQRPNTDNITYVDVRNYVKAQLNLNWDETQASWPNDLNIWCDFLASVAERYDDVSGGEVIDYTSAYTDDTVYCHAVHGALQFGNANGGNMGEYVATTSIYKEANAQWMTFFERPKIIDYNEFYLSVIIESPEDLELLIEEYDINSGLIDYAFSSIADQDYGVYRIPVEYLFTEETSFATAQLLSGVYNELTEVISIDVDVSCAEITDAPIDLTVEAVSGSQIDGSFTDTSGGVAKHQVFWSLTSGSGFILLEVLNEGVTSFSHTGLPSDTTYYYKVRAIQDGVTSEFSNEANASTFYDLLQEIIPDGSNDYMSIPSLDTVALPAIFTGYAWIKIDNWPVAAGSDVFKGLLSSNISGSTGLLTWQLNFNPSGIAGTVQFRMDVRNDAGSIGHASGLSFNQSLLNTGDKILAIYSIDTTLGSSHIKIHVVLPDNTLLSYTGNLTSGFYPTQFRNPYLFTDRLSAGRYLKQKIGEIGFVSGERFTEDQVLELWSNGGSKNINKVITTGSLLWQYKFDNDATDSSGNGYDGTLNNFTGTIYDNW